MAYLYTTPSKKFHPRVKTVSSITQKNILVFSPHSDDISIGAGGFITELAKDNKITPILAYTGWRGVKNASSKTNAIQTREKEMKSEAQILKTKPPIFLRLTSYENEDKINQNKDILKVYSVIKKENPDIIFLPNKNDLHPRHRLLTKTILSALKKYNRKIELFFYEIPWSVFSGNEFNFIVPLKNEAVKTKIKAIKAHPSQLARTDFVRMSKALLAIRAGMVPEQKINGYGSSLNLGKWVEVYKYKKLKKL